MPWFKKKASLEFDLDDPNLVNAYKPTTRQQLFVNGETESDVKAERQPYPAYLYLKHCCCLSCIFRRYESRRNSGRPATRQLGFAAAGKIPIQQLGKLIDSQ
jgi:hypothetical protein